MRDAPARHSRGLDPISAMSWGMEPVRRGQQGRSTIRMGGVYALAPDNASESATVRTASTPAGSAQPADLLLGHHALDVLGLALDAVARASIGLDRQTADDGIDAALLGDGATLRPLQLVVDVIIYRVIVRHRWFFL